MAGLSEFELIEKYFSTLTPRSAEVMLGVGDDCAVIQIPQGQSLCISMDTMVEGVHFPQNAPPEKIAYRALAAAVSDLAAMGASPSHFTLSLTIPTVSEQWLSNFSKGLKRCSRQHKLALVGGDTTKGALTITIQVHGFVPFGLEMKRSGAEVGDIIAVTGTLGDAGAALSILDQLTLSSDEQFLLDRYYEPSPRIAQGKALRGVATSCIDISDGLLADVGHLAERSELHFELNVEKLPLSESLKKNQGETASRLALISGDDYELVFTMPESVWSTFCNKFDENEYTAIGRVTQGEGVRAMFNGELMSVKSLGYQHFG